jgi:hypothetical protein
MAARRAPKFLRWRNTPATAVVVLALSLYFFGVYFGIDAGSMNVTLVTVFAGLILISIGVDLLRLALRFLPMRLLQQNKTLIFMIGTVLIVGSTVYAGIDLIGKSCGRLPVGRLSLSPPPEVCFSGRGGYYPPGKTG